MNITFHIRDVEHIGIAIYKTNNVHFYLPQLYRIFKDNEKFSIRLVSKIINHEVTHLILNDIDDELSDEQHHWATEKLGLYGDTLEID